MPLVSTAEMVQKSLDFMRLHEPPEGYYLGFSGGKDSIVTYQLAVMAGVKFEAYHSCTRIDPPEVYKFIKKHYPEVKWLFPKRTFWAYVRDYGPARITYRWCCSRLKESLGNKIKLKKRLFGIRAEESFRRAKREPVNKYGSQWHHYPIFDWKEFHIWEFIEENKLPYPVLYDEGFSRIGCVICPFIMGRADLKRNMARYPKMFRIFEKCCMEWAESHKNVLYDNNLFMERYYKNERQKKL